MTTLSFGTIARRHTRKKSDHRSILGEELDFYPDFICRKPKLKWSSMKFDSRQLQIMISNSSTQIAKAINTNSPTLRGKPPSTISNSPLLTPAYSPYPLCNLTPREERLSTRPALNTYGPFRTISRSRTTTGFRQLHYLSQHPRIQYRYRLLDPENCPVRFPCHIHSLPKHAPLFLWN